MRSSKASNDSISNLEFIHWEENVTKQTKCSITIEELANED